MNNITQTHDTKLSPIASIAVLVFTLVPVIVNIVYVFLCFKTLRKKFHNLLVLSLCVSDTFLGLSIIVYIIATLSPSFRVNVGICLLQTFMVSFGLVSSYSLILIICLERYAIVKSMNFGTANILDRFKYLAIGGTLAFGFLFTIETIMFTPSEKSMSSCSTPNLYGEQYYLFITFMVGGISIIMLMIFAVSIITSFKIWKIFYYKTISTHPLSSSAEQSRIINHSAENITQKDEDRHEDRNDMMSKVPSCSRGQRVMSNNLESLIKQMRNERIKEEMTRPLIVPTTKATRKPFRFNAWEFRAFSTSLIIAMTTVLFTGPFLVSYWIDYYTGRLMPQQTRFWLTVPIILNTFVNPFIYAWRIPEIRTELRKVFRCQQIQV